MIGDQPGGAARDVSLWARIWAWRRPRKHFFVNSLVTVVLGLMFMLDTRLIAPLLAAAVACHFLPPAWFSREQAFKV